MNCNFCNKPLPYIPHPLQIPPYHCAPQTREEKINGIRKCYIKWWAKKYKKSLLLKR